MKKIIRLTESDLARIVKRVIKESRGVINEGYPYDQLKSNPTNAVIAKALKDAKGTFDDSEAWVVAALQAIKPGQASINAVSEVLSRINGGKAINQWIASFMEGDELTDSIHNGSSVFGQLARIYTNGVSSFNWDVPPTVVALYKVAPTFKDDLKQFKIRFKRAGRSGGGGLQSSLSTDAKFGSM
jgi:hypothetical protein